MAAAAHFSARVYGEVEGQPPFQDQNGASYFTRFKPHKSAQVQSFPTTGTTFWNLPNGYRTPAGSYVYSVIEVQASGLNQHSQKFASDLNAASLATLAG